MITRVALAVGIAVGLVAASLAAKAQPASFLQGLRDLGYVDGRNVVIEYRDAARSQECS